MNSFASTQYNHETPAALPFSCVHGKKPSADEIYSRIFDAILEQRIGAMNRFTEDSLGQTLGVNRSDIRRVLTRLSHEQVVILRPNHRPRVAAPSCEQTRQILHARRLTETTLVQLASQQQSPGELNKLRELIEDQRHHLQLGQRGSAIRLCGEFHLQLGNMAGNVPLAHFLGSLVPLTSLAIALHGSNTDDGSWRRHAAIVDALERNEASIATQLVSQHLDVLEQRLIRTMQ